jgi:hypothetical protein
MSRFGYGVSWPILALTPNTLDGLYPRTLLKFRCGISHTCPQSVGWTPAHSRVILSDPPKPPPSVVAQPPQMGFCLVRVSEPDED